MAYQTCMACTKTQELSILGQLESPNERFVTNYEVTLCPRCATVLGMLGVKAPSAKAVLCLADTNNTLDSFRTNPKGKA